MKMGINMWFTGTCFRWCSLFVTFYLLGVIHAVDQAVFFENGNFGGNSLSLTISEDCYTLKRPWSDKASSVQVLNDDCVVVWDYENCRGRSIQLQPNTPGADDLGQLDFDKQIRSISLCSSSNTPVELIPIFGDRTGMGSRDRQQTTTREINLYDEPNFAGSIFTLTTSGGCYTLKTKWINRISSLDPQDVCVIAWDRANCQGESISLSPSAAERGDLKLVNFDKRINSVRLCPQQDSDLTTGGNNAQMQGDRQHGYDMQNEENNEEMDADADIADIALQEHNMYRRLHGVPDLKSNSMLQRTAQAHADYLARNDEFEHSSNNDFGENIAGTSTRNKIEALKEVIGLWYNEIGNYDFKNPRYSLKGIKAGHFTALVWKSTTDVGVGMLWNPIRNWWVVVANYDPPGNLKGAYDKNVPPPLVLQ